MRIVLYLLTLLNAVDCYIKRLSNGPGGCGNIGLRGLNRDESSFLSKHKGLELISLRDRIRELYGPDIELQESYIKASGPGGQKINKSNICVQLVCSSSVTDDKKIVIKSKSHRSLLLNRIEATKILLNKLADIETKRELSIQNEKQKESRRILKLSALDKKRKRLIKETRSKIKSKRSKQIPNYDDE